MEVGGRKELEPVRCQSQMLLKQRPEALRRGFADQGHTGNAWEQGNWRGFLSITPVSLRLEDSFHVGLGREAVRQDGFLVAGHMLCAGSGCIWSCNRSAAVWDPVC